MIHQTGPVRTPIFLALCLAGLCFVAGCKKQAIQGSNLPVADLGSPIRISADGSDAAEPAIAAAPDGSAYVAWVEHRGKDADVMCKHISGAGQLSAAAVRVNTQTGQATAWRGDQPTIALAPDQTVFVGWTARAGSESGHATDIYLSASRDHGQTFSAPVKVNDDPQPAVHGMHSLVIANDGRVYVAWLDERNVTPVPMKDMKMDGSASAHHMESNREVFIASSSDGGRTFSANRRVATNACPCCKVAMAVNSDGRLYVSWRQVLPGDFRHIAVSASADQGKTFTTPVIVSDDHWVLAGCPVSGATLSIAADGMVRVLWYSEGKNGQTGLYWAESRDQGATFGPRQILTAGTTRGTPVLIGDPNRLAAVWQDAQPARIMIAPRIAESTTPDSFVIAGKGELPAAAANNQRTFVAYIAKETTGQGVWLVTIGKRG